jgi:hypothetical protein
MLNRAGEAVQAFGLLALDALITHGIPDHAVRLQRELLRPNPIEPSREQIR